MQFTYDLMAFYLDSIVRCQHNDRYNILREIFALFLAYRKGFDCSILFADITANGNPHADFTYLREVTDNELLDLVQGNATLTKIDIARFDDVIKLICQKACSDINHILRSIEAPCFARISGIQIIVESRGDIKESIYLGPTEAIAYIEQLIEKYSQPEQVEADRDSAEISPFTSRLMEITQIPPRIE